MKNKIYLLFILILYPCLTLAQEFNFNIHETSLKEYLKIEKALGSQQIPTVSNHVSFNGEAQPIKYLRNEELIPDLIVFYYFKKIDSTMTYVLYEWDVRHFKDVNKSHEKESDELEEALIQKYRDLKKFISTQFGEPFVEKNYSNISQLDSVNTFVESSLWNPNDSTEIEMHATVSNLYKKQGAIAITPVHRIRLYVRNKSKDKTPPVPELTDDKLESLKSLAHDFLHALESEDYINSKEYLSDLIRDKTTDQQLTDLGNAISYYENSEILYSGIQMSFDGKIFVVLVIKYSDDSNPSLSQTIKFSIDDKDKIAGAQLVQ